MSQTGAWAQHTETDDVVLFKRVGGRFEFEAEVLGDASGNDPGQAEL